MERGALLPPSSATAPVGGPQNNPAVPLSKRPRPPSEPDKEPQSKKKLFNILKTS